jgi:hypothetical protein
MSPYNTDADRSSNDSATIEPLIPRSNQIDFVAKFDAAIWGDVGSSLQTKGGLPLSAEKKGALAVAPVAGGKTLILVMLAVMAIIQRFCRRVIIVAHPGFRGDEAMLGGCATRGCVEMTRLRLLSCSAFT